MTEELKPEHRARVILVVEADFLTRWGASEYLREIGFEVIEAVNAEEAFAALHAATLIDAIFCDSDAISGHQGSGFLACLDDRHPNLPVLLISNGVAAGELKPMPTRASIGKPYRMIDVEQQLNALIAEGNQK